MTSTKDWVSGMLMSISEAFEAEGYRLTGAILPPAIYDGVAHASLEKLYTECGHVPVVHHIKMHVGSGEVLLTRGVAMAFDLRAVPL